MVQLFAFTYIGSSCQYAAYWPLFLLPHKKISKDMDNLMAVRMMYGTGKWYKRQGLPKETDLNNEQIGK